MSALFLWGCGKESDESEVQSTGTEDETAVVGSETEEGHWELPEGYALSPRFEYAGGETKMRDVCMAENPYIIIHILIIRKRNLMKIISMSRKKGRKNSSCLSGKRRL